jgi:cytochrome c oxidase subunit III
VLTVRALLAIDQVGGLKWYRATPTTRRGPEQARGITARHNARVTTAAPSISQRVHSLNRPNMVSVGTIIWLSSELMFFAGLFAMFFTVKAQNTTEHWPPEPTELNVPYALVVTIVLVASSFTCQMGVFAAEKGDVFGLRRWYLLTLIMGTIFVLGQANEYRSLISEGTTIPSSAYGTVFYLTTGFHGLHVTGGLVAFVFLLIRTRLSKFTPAQATSAIVVSYYWHFVDVVWIGLFTVIYFIP